MRIRNLYNAKDIINESEYIIKNPQDYKGRYKHLFDNDNPIHLEIGMGKGSFLLNIALLNPNINYIGIEKYDTIVAKAIEKISAYNLTNLKIIRIDALELDSIFEKEIALIYLNFSDPWPKAKHAKRRLTSHIFLNIYDKLFIADKLIKMKTDNLGLFESSVESLTSYGYEIIEKSNNHNSRVKTEYEEKFINRGIKINYLSAFKEK